MINGQLEEKDFVEMRKQAVKKKNEAMSVIQDFYRHETPCYEECRLYWEEDGSCGCDGCDSNLGTHGGCMYFEKHEETTTAERIEQMRLSNAITHLKQLRNCVALGELPQVEDLMSASELNLICEKLEQ